MSNVVYCVYKVMDEGCDCLIWICTEWEIAQSFIDKFGYKAGSYRIEEEYLENTHA